MNTDVTNALTSDRMQNMSTTVTLAATGSGSPKKKKYEEIKAIRIANNSINNLKILVNPFSTLFDTTKVTWLDISFNQIEKISLEIFEIFPNITALYLQANAISRLSEIKKLEKDGTSEDLCKKST